MSVIRSIDIKDLDEFDSGNTINLYISSYKNSPMDSRLVWFPYLAPSEFLMEFYTKHKDIQDNSLYNALEAEYAMRYKHDGIEMIKALSQRFNINLVIELAWVKLVVVKELFDVGLEVVF